MYVLEIDDKSSFSMSGHVGPLEALVQLRIRPTSSSRVLRFTATDSALAALYDYYDIVTFPTLPLGPNHKVRPCARKDGCTCTYLAVSCKVEASIRDEQ